MSGGSTSEKYAQMQSSHNIVSTFVSEDVYAQTRGPFTKVSCGDVYAFESIATSGDFSSEATSLDSMLQVAIEVTLPTGNTELLVLQPQNLLSYPLSTRVELVDKLFNNGSVWIAEFSQVFSPGLFPKTWDMMIVPDIDSVEKVISYKSDGFTNMYSSGKEEAVSITGSLFIMFVGLASSGMLSITMNSIYPLLAFAGMFYFILKYGFDSIVDYSQQFFELNTSHFWAQQQSCSSLDSLSPVPEEVQQEIYCMLTEFTGEWTQVTVEAVSESPSQTVLTVSVCNSEHTFTIPCKTPQSASDSFLLNQIVSELGVGSVQMLEDEVLEVGVSTLGNEDDVTLNSTYRLRTV